MTEKCCEFLSVSAKMVGSTAKIRQGAPLTSRSIFLLSVPPLKTIPIFLFDSKYPCYILFKVVRLFLKFTNEMTF